MSNKAISSRPAQATAMPPKGGLALPTGKFKSFDGLGLTPKSTEDFDNMSDEQVRDRIMSARKFVQREREFRQQAWLSRQMANDRRERDWAVVERLHPKSASVNDAREMPANPYDGNSSF